MVDSKPSKTEVKGGVIRYTRTFELKELSLPVDRAITGDERNTVALRAVAR